MSFDKKIARLKSLDINKILFRVYQDQGLQVQVLDLNTQTQLYEQGIDSEGKSLGEYSDYTVEYKRLVNQRYDHITLKDSGDFYDSFKFKPFKDGGFEITADSIKEDEQGITDLTEEFGEEIIGLTDDSKEFIQAEIKEAIIEKVREILR